MAPEASRLCAIKLLLTLSQSTHTVKNSTAKI